MSKVHTVQMETDTVTEEREVLLQRALSAQTPKEARDVRAQIMEHIAMYEGDEGASVLEDQLLHLETLIGENVPAVIDYSAQA